jgi:beta-galactosidase
VNRALAALAAAVISLTAVPAAEQSRRHTFIVGGTSFVYDGRPVQILSGEMHYPRIPRAYWRDRMRKARAMGLNTISTYVFWNLHEPRPGQWDFSGNLDVAAFVKTAQEEGLHVILRPGPYVCAEWDLGGYPAWLLADRTLILRSTDPRFMAASAAYLRQVGRQLAALQVGRGGPIIAVQVENEYGAFDKDADYVRAVRDQFVAAGFTEAPLFTADTPCTFANGALPDLPVVANFGPGNAQKSFAALKEFRPNGPIMSGEYWAGWFDAWGTRHANTNGKQQADEIAWMLAQGHSFNLYMFHGGTSFGPMSGANADRNGYKPDVSSYDYDSALDEAGRPAAKFALFRDAIQAHDPSRPLPPLPAPLPSMAVPAVTLDQHTSLFDVLPAPIRSERPKSMEELGQSYGYILYRTTLNAAVSGELKITELHDYALVFVNGQREAVLDRRQKQDTTTIAAPAGSTLDILVENTARSNYGKPMRDERKGITEKVTLAGAELTGWSIYPLAVPSPFDSKSPKTTWQMSSAARFLAPRSPQGRSAARAVAPRSPALHRGSFTVSTPADTFLDLRAWTKGMVWVNGFPLGRFWNIGPQQTLFLPAPFMKKGRNDVVVLDLFDAPASPTLSGLKDPILNEVKR